MAVVLQSPAPENTERMANRSALPQAGGPVAAPPLALPALHFAAALLWLAVATALLPAAMAPLVRGLVFDPAVLAMVHAIMLGTMGTAIFGTLLQFVPAGLGVPLRSVRLGYWGFVLQQVGVAALLAGFWWWRGSLQGIGWLFMFAAVGAHSRNTLRARRHSVNGRMVGTYVTIAHSALGVGLFIAAARIGETMGWWHVDRLYLLAAHAVMGAVGFGTLSAIGVGSRMLPTFLAAPGDDRRWLVAHLWITTTGLILFAVGAVFTQTVVMRVGAIALLVGGALTATLLGRWFFRRQRALDPALWYVASASTALVASVGMAVVVFVTDAHALQHWAALLVALFFGWLTTLVVGVTGKILPHVTFVRLAPQRPHLRALGTPTALLHPGLLYAGVTGFSAGWVLLATGVWAQQALITNIGIATWSLGTLATLLNYTRLFVNCLPTTTPVPPASGS
ncbi:MAG TPA: hypothetical protein DGD08_03415 [Gemmatimonas aurantiaca]|uniref:Uncharacterized protein n=2 Tax=Gemmatimonas aurantiaca TaxID=173480 RepID=A0A3D4V543_9BACT|nr:hypothetical protein [Gemmatimonas aurantiaca]HCT56243.1 hypothetical protein [Gemmatimonas aurantiaca]